MIDVNSQERRIMNSKFEITNLLCGALLGAALVFTVGAAKSRHTSWDYTTHYYSSSHPDTVALSKLGNEGWEMVDYFGGHDDKKPGFIFKRER